MKDVGKKLTVLLSEVLDERFREAVFKTKGMRKGNITEAVEEALQMWINRQRGKEEK